MSKFRLISSEKRTEVTSTVSPFFEADLFDSIPWPLIVKMTGNDRDQYDTRKWFPGSQFYRSDVSINFLAELVQKLHFCSFPDLISMKWIAEVILELLFSIKVSINFPTKFNCAIRSVFRANKHNLSQWPWPRPHRNKMLSEIDFLGHRYFVVIFSR